ncbi:hypothetical protein DFH08DRAFT_828414 [Mycena albidolilacea]|uniref:Uncharacterized protein n=1 Tax=Mycena albidolilacea TaxID=1033008 RepID=A0AAD7E6Y5_9AGAR|nr:hypothetical protein DFH08DRAFT_828414 [Mycena albidolilacea]
MSPYPSEVEKEPADAGTGTEQGQKNTGNGKTGKKAKPEKVFTPVDKIHSSIVHILHPEIRRKKARVLIYKLTDPEYPSSEALDAFVADMACGLMGKAKATGLATKKKWEMHSSDWEFIDKLMDALELLQAVTLELSRKGVPIVPFTMIASLANKHEFEEPQIVRVFVQAPKRRNILHPVIHLTFFETKDWDFEVVQRAHELLTEMVRKYLAVTLTASTSSKPVKGIFAMAVKGGAEMKKNASSFAGKDEVDMYIGGIYPVGEGFDDPLG